MPQTIVKIAAIALFILLFGCADKMPLPSSPQNLVFGSGDTTYIHLAGDWTAHGGLPLWEPCDLVAGPDGRVFVADRGNGRIVAFDRSGAPLYGQGMERLTGFDSLTAIGQDAKLNLFIADGGPEIYYWNQYVNWVGVEAVLDYFVVVDTLEGDTAQMSFLEYGALYTTQPDRYVVISAVFSDDPARIDSALGPSLFYQEPTGHARYHGVAGGTDETVYVSDQYFDEVDRLTLIPSNLMQLADGQYAYTYMGVYDCHIATYGTGMGTTLDPGGLYVQVQGGQHYVYFSQTAGNFLVQKIREQGTGNFFSSFGPETDVMQLNRFANPRDVWVAGQYLGNNWIFVADTDSHRVQVFNPVGDFLMYAGERRVGSGSSALEIFDQLSSPEAVAHFEGILYVADTGHHRICRYALSTDVENIPGQ